MDDGSSGPQDVAEAHGHVPARLGPGEVGREPLRDALAVAQDAGGLGRLVRRDVDDGADTDLGGRRQDIQRAEDVGLPGFERERLQEGQVLERRGMEDEVGLGGREDGPHRREIADVREDDLVALKKTGARDAHLGVQQPGLVPVEHVQLRRTETCDLAAQLGTDRSTSSGDQDGLPCDLVSDGGRVECDGTPTEEVLDVHVAEVVGRRPTADDLSKRRQDECRQTGLDSVLAQLSDQRRVGEGEGDDEGRRVVLLGYLGDVMARSADRDPFDAKTPLARVVVEKSHREVPAVALPHAADQASAGVSGAEHDDSAIVGLLRAPVRLQGPDEETPGEHADERQGATDNRHTPRSDSRVCQDGPCEQDRARDDHGAADIGHLFEGSALMANSVRSGDCADGDLHHGGRQGDPKCGGEQHGF